MMYLAKIKNLLVLGLCFGVLTSCSYKEIQEESPSPGVHLEEIDFLTKDVDLCDNYGQPEAFDLDISPASTTPYGVPVGNTIHNVIDYLPIPEWTPGEHCLCEIDKFLLVYQAPNANPIATPVAFTPDIQEISVSTPVAFAPVNGSQISTTNKWQVEITGNFDGQIFLGWPAGVTNTATLIKASGLCIIDNISGPNETQARTYVWKHETVDERGNDVVNVYIPPTATTDVHWLLP